jgi:hypothetical protein
MFGFVEQLYAIQRTMGEHSAFYRKIERCSGQCQVSIYACWTDTLFSPSLLETIECESVDLRNPGLSADKNLEAGRLSGSLKVALVCDLRQALFFV